MPIAPSTPPRPFSCLVVEDDAGFASLLGRLVRESGGEPTLCTTLAEAGGAVAGRAFDLLLLDNHLPDGKVYDFFAHLDRRCPDAPKIMITGASDLGEAVALTRNGLFEYLTKPVDVAVVEATLRRALLRLHARHAADGPSTDLELGTSPAMREVVDQLRQAARHPSAVVLITGETGVGKDVAVRALHRMTHGEHADAAPYVAVNCAAVPGEMFEAELFGAERGAYTGADRRRPGLAAAARRGTLFLDEIGEVPLALQPKLLRFLEGREFRALGATETERFEGRLVAATHRDLRAEVAAGRFREDLLFRIEVFTIAIPPLRDRPEDIPWLAERVLADLAARYDRVAPQLAPDDLQVLARHRFPGNARELRNILERALLRTPPDQRWLVLDRAWLGARLPASTPAATPSPTPVPPSPDDALPPERADLAPLEAQEYRMIREALRETRGAIRRSAARLGLSPQALLRRLDKWPELRPNG